MLWSCTDSSLLHLIRTRDPSGKGLHSALALRLLMLLLHWNPALRPTPEQVCAAAAAFPRRSLQIKLHSHLQQGSSSTQGPRWTSHRMLLQHCRISRLRQFCSCSMLDRLQGCE